MTNTDPRRIARLIAALSAAWLLAACATEIDPERPPLYEYEPPPLDNVPSPSQPSRV